MATCVTEDIVAIKNRLTALEVQFAEIGLNIEAFQELIAAREDLLLLVPVIPALQLIADNLDDIINGIKPASSITYGSLSLDVVLAGLLDIPFTKASDYPSLAAACAAAGIGGNVLLKPGATYELDAGIVLPVRQRIVGYGAIVKRANQAVSTTTTGITSGVTAQVTLNNATNFKVGMQVAFAQLGVARKDLVAPGGPVPTLSDIRTITAKNGNQITLNVPVNAAISAGGTCFQTFFCFTMTEGSRIEGVVFDGNEANWPYTRWEVTSEIVTDVSFHQSIFANRFLNSPGEAISLYATDVRVTQNFFSGIGGNAVHLSGAERAQVTGNIGLNGNLDTDNGHGDGGVCYSNGNTQTLITDNIFRGFISGVGGINDTDANGSVTNNDFSDMYCCGIEGGAGIARFNVINNRMKNIGTNPSAKVGLPFYAGIALVGITGDGLIIAENSVTDLVGATLAAGVSMTGAGTGLLLANNTFDGPVSLAACKNSLVTSNVIKGTLQVDVASDLKIFDNRITQTNPAGFPIRTSSAGDYSGFEIGRNVIIGGAYGVHLHNGASTWNRVKIEDNEFYNQEQRAINIPSFAGSTVNAFWIKGNLIQTGPNSDIDYLGMVIEADGLTIEGNELNNILAASSRFAFFINAASTPNLVIARNRVSGPWAQTLSLTANAATVVVGNILKTVDVQNPTGNTVSGTIVIA